VAFLCAFVAGEHARAAPQHPVPIDSSQRRGARAPQIGRPSPRASTPVTRASVRAANGTLVVIANVLDASVTIDGQPVGGVTAELPLGTYHVRVTAPGRLPATAEPTISRAGQVVTVRANLPPDPPQRSAGGVRDAGQLAVSDMRPPPSAGDGLLTLASEPSATVRLDGDSIGVTPIRDYRLPFGEYYLRLVRSGFRDAERMITVRRGTTTSLTMSLRPGARP
jgi:hypothetical protein